MDKIIIIGAPRSGTNMLRDMLVELHGVGTWPCDEINYIWRHGNIRYPSDEFTPGMATAEIRQFVQHQFCKIAKKQKVDTVVEKTCANSLRVGFIDRILPEAKYIFIVRDGIDAVASTMKRWKAQLDLPYILRKARYVPPVDIPYYSSRYLLNRFYKLVSKENRLSSWGPTIDGIDEYLEELTLPEVCALQWKSCIENAERDFESIALEKVHRVKYEDFVKDPIAEFAYLADFIDKKVPELINMHLKNNVSQESVGKGKRDLNNKDIVNINKQLSAVLATYGY